MYQVKTIDLNNAVADANPTQLVPPGKRIAEVFCLNVPAGSTFKIRFGSGDLFTINAPFTFEPTGDEDNNNGLYFSNPTVTNASVELVIVFAQAGSSGLNPIFP